MSDRCRRNERGTAVADQEADMTEVYLVLYGASIVASVLLFTIAIWTSIKRRVEFAALERRVRERMTRPRPVAPLFSLAATDAPHEVVAPRRRQTAA
jgi:hypothetical protein